jgi:hypothetical protein
MQPNSEVDHNPSTRFPRQENESARFLRCPRQVSHPALGLIGHGQPPARYGMAAENGRLTV